MTEQRLPAVNGDDGSWGDILNQFLSKEHLNTGADFAGNGGHQHITITAGTTSLAPLTFTSGGILSSPADGSVEYDGSFAYLTVGTTRKKIAAYNVASGAAGDTYYRDAGNNFATLPKSSDGSLLTLASGIPAWTSTVSSSSISGLGTASAKNTGNTVVDPGTGGLEVAVPTSTVTGASKTYVAADRGKAYQRSNSGAAMTDTLPSAVTMGNGYEVTIANADTVIAATLTLTSAAGNFPNGTTTFVLNYGRRQSFTSDGTNWTFVRAGNGNLLKIPSGTIAAGDFVQITDSTGATTNRTAANVRSDLGLAASATTDTTNAVNISSGTLPAGRLPALTGDITTSLGTVATTLATVNSNVGTFGTASSVSTFTVNAKGLITAASNTPIAIASTAVSGLAASATTDTTNAANITSGTLPAGRLPALTGDITTTVGTAATTLATVNSNTGSWGIASSVPAITVNAKGLITAASNTPIAITESQVTNLTTDLASKASDANVIHTTGAETMAGTKTFSSTPTFSAGVTLTGGSAPGYVQGKLVYDTDNESLTFFNSDSNISLQVGQEEWVRVKNVSGSTIANGSAIYFSGTSGGMPTIALAQANAGSTTVGMGLTTEAIANNAVGYITTIGVVHGLNTASFTAGGAVYISDTTAGGLTQTAPVAPSYRYRVGMVTVSDATVGAVHVTPSTAALGNGTANQLFGMNSAGTSQEVKSIVGTTNDISVTHSANTITLDVGSNIAKPATPIAVQTANYSANAGDFVPVDATSGALTVTLPAAPADKTVIIVKKNDSTTNAISINTSGTDRYNSVSGGTLQQLVLQNQTFSFQYAASIGVWYITGQYAAVAQLDSRYVNKTTVTAKGDLVVGTAASTVANQVIGANNTILTADSSQTNGLKWTSTITSPTITGAAISTSTLTAPVIAASTASPGSAMVMSTGTLLTTAEVGALEFDGTNFYATATASSRQVVQAEQFITLTAARTLTSQTAAQKMFSTPTNGAVTLPVGSYFFDSFFTLSAMSTGTTASFGWTLAAGTAVIGGILWQSEANKAALATAAAASNTVNTAANTAITAANLTATGWAHVWGKVRITTAGTVIPSVSLGAASAAVVGADSFFRIWSIGSNSVTSVGNWS